MANERERRLPRAPRIKVTVTQEIIDAAVAADSGHCMIADAIKASVPWEQKRSNPSADIATLRVTDQSKGLRYIYMTPYLVSEKIIGFDAGQKPEPFTFELRNGMTTRSVRRVTLPDGTVTKDQRYGKTKLVTVKDSKIPEKRGGRPPKMGALAGGAIGAVAASRRRSFGLRAMDKFVSPEAARAVLAQQDEDDA